MVGDAEAMLADVVGGAKESSDAAGAAVEAAAEADVVEAPVPDAMSGAAAIVPETQRALKRKT